VRRTAELYADPNSNDKQDPLITVGQEMPILRSAVYARIARLRLLQAQAAMKPTDRDRYRQAAEECISEILSQPVIGTSDYYWAKTYRELKTRDLEFKTSDSPSELGTPE